MRLRHVPSDQKFRKPTQMKSCSLDKRATLYTENLWPASVRFGLIPRLVLSRCTCNPSFMGSNPRSSLDFSCFFLQLVI